MMRTMLALTLFAAWGFAEDEHVGPHKGVVVEWGEEEYHLELVTDPKTGEATVYVYGDHKAFHDKKMKPIEAKSITLTVKGEKPKTIKLEPKPAKGDPAGSSTVFVGKDDTLKTEKKLEGSLSGKLGTKPYSGDFKQK